jgi:hypothetical protein
MTGESIQGISVIFDDLTMKNGGLMGFNQQKWWF